MNWDSSADEIANYIIATASFHKNVYNVNQIILFQLLPRYPGDKSARAKRKAENYNAIAADINIILKQECGRINFLNFWDDHDFSFPGTREDRYNNAAVHMCPDGVHFKTMFRVFRCLRGVVSRSRWSRW